MKKRMGIKLIAIIVAAAFTMGASAQGIITGRITDSEEKTPVAGAAVIIRGIKGTATDNEGRYSLAGVPAGTHSVEVTMLGYVTCSKSVEVSDLETLRLDIVLQQSYIEADEVVVSATRTENTISRLPTRVSLVSSGMIKSTPALTIDDYLTSVPGVNIGRSFGIFSHKANVTMRGLSGNNQARVLVMIDGIPVNKADGGSVNWNLLDPDLVERIEIVKGPASAVYGSNAMGGAINIITRKPKDKLSGSVKAGYGTYNTITGRVNLSQRFNPEKGRGFYYMLNGFHRQSDGYITQSVYDQQANPFIVPSNVWELSGGLKVGYDFSRDENIEIDFTVYDDERGTGEKVYMPNGNTTDHDTWQARARYRIRYDKLKGDLSLFWLNENYRKVNEYIKDDYTWYDVYSRRVDAGILSSVTYNVSATNSLTGGIDLRLGGVDACDMYYTSTDIVYNRGSMFTTGLYLQDELSLADDRLKVVAGLRYDLAKFYNGAFYVETPSAETSFMDDIVDRDMDHAVWNALSPRISLNYSPGRNYRFYMSYGRGFRPSVLDDLCRSGRMKGGFKLANQGVKPEYLANLEAGGDIGVSRNVRTSLSVYYSVGRDFLYYVNTGDSIEMGFGLRPIYINTNIPKVHIGGIESGITYNPVRDLTISGSYSFSYSVITRYTPLDPADPIDLTGNHLTDVPSHIATISARWENRIVNVGVTGRYQSTMWVNDLNVYDEVVRDDTYPAYFVCDIRLSKEIKFITVDLSVQNLFDTKFYDSKGAVCPGRFITLEAGVRF